MNIDISYSIENSKEAKDSLVDSISELMKQDIIGAKNIRSLLKTDSTFDKSLGTIYRYLIDRQKCLTGCKNVLDCPNPTDKGYRYILSYDDNSDRLTLALEACPYLESVNNVLSNIEPCDISKMSIAKDSSSLVNVISKDGNYNKMRSSYAFIKYISTDIKSYDSEKTIKSKLLYSLNDKSLGRSLLKLAAYQYAKNDHSVSYINAHLFFDNLFKYSDPSTTSDLRKIMDVDVLILDGIDEIPFIADDKATKFIIPLLEKRSKPGKRTYALIGKKVPTGNLFYNRNYRSEITSLLDNIFEEMDIKDLDLR